MTGPEAWLGAPPEHWQTVHLGRLGALSKGSGGSKEDNRPEGVPVVRYGELYSRFGTVITRAHSFIDADATHRYTPLRPGTIIFTASGEDPADIGRSSLSRVDGPAYVGGDTVLFSPNTAVVYPEFLAYALESHPVKAMKELRATGFTVVHINAGKLKTLPLPLPPINEQRAIADYLDRETAEIDLLIEKQTALIDRLRERRTAVIRLHTRSGVYPLSDGWRRLPIRRLARLITGTTPVGEVEEVFDPAGTKGWITPEDLQGIVEPKRFLTAQGWVQMRAVPKGSALVCCIGATVGKVGWAAQKLSSNQQITGLAPHHDVSGRYLYLALLGEKTQVVERSVGNTIPILNNRRLAEVEISIPGLSEQEDIVAYLDRESAKIDELITKTERFIELTRERRSALITAAVTGQIDVTEKQGVA